MRTRPVALPLALFLGSTALGTLSARWLGEGYASLVFVLGITLIGAVSGLAIAVASAVVGALIFNFLVSAPVYDINFSEIKDFAPPVIFTTCAVVSGLLSGRLKDQTGRVRQSNQRLEHLLEASRAMQRVNGVEEVAWALRATATARFGLDIALYRMAGALPVAIDGAARAPEWLALAGEAARRGTEPVRAGALVAVPLAGGAGTVGVMVAQGAADDGFVAALARVVALALERAALAGEVGARAAEVRALARTEELKTSLLSSVSHDLRTPLTTIATAAQSLATFGDTLPADDRRALLGEIVGECDRLNRLTANLLELSRLQGGALAPAVIPAAELIRAVLNAARPLAGTRRLTLAAPRGEVLVEADRVLFELALTNVVQNAVHYSPDGSAIALALAVEDECCVIDVTDQGSGIPAAEQARVFERFYRGAAAQGARRGHNGSGLGLAIARGFVEAAHGSIALVSPTPDGPGTRITIRLPLARAAMAAA